jgi:hypothetical protein
LLVFLLFTAEAFEVLFFGGMSISGSRMWA